MSAKKKSPGAVTGPRARMDWKLVLQVLGIVAAALWIYWPALRGDWLWDDDFYVTANPLMHDPDRLWNTWFGPGSFWDYYPITATVQWIQWLLWGTNTLGYHLTNVALHIASAFLVWRLLGKLGLRLAWLGGLLFAIHPVQVESVAWITELKNTLSLPLFLLAMCAWIDYEEHKLRRDYFWAAGWFLLAMLCKINMVLFPLVILLHAWWKRGRIGWNDVKICAPFLAISLVLGAVNIYASTRFYQIQPRIDAVHPIGLFPRIALAGISLAFYIWKCFWPTGLLPIYPVWKVDPPSPEEFLPYVALGGLLFWFWRERKGWGKHALLGVGFFLLMLAPCPGMLAAPNMNFTWVMDHFLYLPLIGLIGLVMAGLERLDDRLPKALHPYGVGAVVVTMALLAYDGHTYAGKYINQKTLWTYTVGLHPQAFSAYSNLGMVYYNANQVQESIPLFERSLEIKPDFVTAHVNLGNALFDVGRVPEAIEQFQLALKLSPGFAAAHSDYGTVLYQINRNPEAIEQFEEAVKIDPNFEPAHNNLGNSLVKAGRTYDGIDEFKKALQIDPDAAEVHYNLGHALLSIGQVEEAVGHIEEAVKLEPDNAEMHYNLAGALAQAGQKAAAMEQYELALKFNPNYSQAHNNLGVSLAQQGRYAEANEQFEAAVRCDPHNINAQNNLVKMKALEKKAPAK